MCHQRMLTQLFTLSDTETDKKWVVQNYLEVFILHRDKHQHRFPLGSLHLFGVEQWERTIRVKFDMRFLPPESIP